MLSENRNIAFTYIDQVVNAMMELLMQSFGFIDLTLFKI